MFLSRNQPFTIETGSKLELHNITTLLVDTKDVVISKGNIPRCFVRHLPVGGCAVPDHNRACALLTCQVHSSRC